MKLFFVVCTLMIVALSGVVAMDAPRPLDAGRHPFVNGALTIELPAGGFDRTEDALASATVSGFRYVRWDGGKQWVASAAMPTFALRRLFESGGATALESETIALEGADEAHLVLRDNVGRDGVPDAWGLVLFVGDVGYEINAGFDAAVDGAREAARATVLSTRIEA